MAASQHLNPGRHILGAQEMCRLSEGRAVVSSGLDEQCLGQPAASLAPSGPFLPQWALLGRCMGILASPQADVFSSVLASLVRRRAPKEGALLDIVS